MAESSRAMAVPGRSRRREAQKLGVLWCVPAFRHDAEMWAPPHLDPDSLEFSIVEGRSQAAGVELDFLLVAAVLPCAHSGCQ
jgi:hypothetical protein